MKNDEASTAAALGISATERETGIAKETLRVWERRYGFPKPERDDAGDRVYPAAQVQRLVHIRRALDLGYRPARVMAMADGELQALSPRTPAAHARRGTAPRPGTLEPVWLDRIRDTETRSLGRALKHELAERGLGRFVLEVAVPLVFGVGEAWACGELEVRHEHLCSQALGAVLRAAIDRLPTPAPGAPRVLLTTLPGELHGQGLLMAEALLALEGADCVSLGTQTPVAQIAAAARHSRVDLVALSCSAHARGEVLEALAELRAQLPPEMGLWAGGSARALHRRPIAGVRVFASLDGLGAALAVAQRAARQAGEGAPATR